MSTHHVGTVHHGTFLVLLSFAACRPVPHVQTVDATLLYAAALGAPDLLRYGHRLALQRYLMSDSGTYQASGLLADTVVAFLRNRGVVAELCTPFETTNHVPQCQADSARAELRVSRPVPVGDTAYVIFVSQASIRARNDTSGLRLAFATAHKCRVARQGAAWHLRRCDLFMIT